MTTDDLVLEATDNREVHVKELLLILLGLLERDPEVRAYAAPVITRIVTAQRRIDQHRAMVKRALMAAGVQNEAEARRIAEEACDEAARLS